MHEARKFLPVDGFVNSVRPVQLQEKVGVESTRASETDMENHTRDLSHDNLRTSKYPHPEDVVLQEGRMNKKPAVFTESMVGPEAFEMVLLRDGEQTGSPPHETLKSGENINDPKVFNPKGSSGGKSRGKMKIGGRRNAVNFKRVINFLCSSCCYRRHTYTLKSTKTPTAINLNDQYQERIIN
ncbi:hypothetical protein Leryth_018217 [Lithospermum erythrorhizon]|nr:hypothetical protein Leryth_018217 [Lithospermum erythrorhizon]